MHGLYIKYALDGMVVNLYLGGTSEMFMSSSASLHVIFGAGQIGASLARLLQSRGLRVRVVRRGNTPVGDGIEVVAGDAMDPAFTRDVTSGAAVLYHCMNPSTYSGEAWEREFPAQGEALIAAALASGARLVCLDNLYSYGISEGRRTEASVLAAEGRKGRVRAAWAVRLQQAGGQGLKFVMGRAGDFFGPGSTAQALMGIGMVTTVARGDRAWLIGAADAPHAFSYVPDVVSGLAALGTAGVDVEGQVFHLPILEVAPAEMVRRFGAATGKPGRSTALPGWVVKVLGVVVPLFRELTETLYQWDRPFLADDGRFRARFPGVATDLDAAVRGSVTAAR